MDMQDMNVRALLELTASDAPAPGGGAIAAMSGAFGAALAAMVGSLTLSKTGYESVQEEMAETTAQASAGPAPVSPSGSWPPWTRTPTPSTGIWRR